MSIKTRSVYWMHLTTNVPSLTSSLIILLGMTNYLRIVQNHNGFIQSDLISRNSVIDVQNGSKLSISSAFNADSIQWSSFRLDNCLSPLYVFQVARSSSQASDGLITYDLVLTNIGSAWNTEENSFKVPLTGQYFFSLSVGMGGNQVYISLSFEVNGVKILTTYSGLTAMYSSGYDLYSASKLLPLNAQDVFTTTVIGNISSEQPHAQISLAGFYYSPAINSKVGLMNFKNSLL